MRSCDCVLKRSGHLDTETSVQRGKTVKEHRKKNVLSSGPRESAARWTYLFECPQITLRSTCPNRNSSSFFKKKNLSLLLHASFQTVALPSVRPLALERFSILPNLCLPSPIYRYVLPVLSPDVLSVAPSPVPPGPSWPLAVSQLHFHQIHGHQVSANMNISVGRPHPLTTGCRIIFCA